MLDVRVRPARGTLCQRSRVAGLVPSTGPRHEWEQPVTPKTVSETPVGNRLLAALPAAEAARMVAGMSPSPFATGDVVYRAGGPIRDVYFPRFGAFSLVAVTEDGRSAEAGAVGNEGMVGLAAFHGAVRSRVQVVCQVAPCTALRMAGADFQRESGRPGPFRDLLHRYALALFDQVALNAACNVLHAAPQRCARWLLTARDRAGSDEFPLTHEFLAAMLGVRRATVTIAALAFQSTGAIAYRQGRVRVLNRARLEAAACGCYRAARDYLDRPP